MCEIVLERFLLQGWSFSPVTIKWLKCALQAYKAFPLDIYFEAT